MAEASDEPVEPSTQKTCVLKASIHCEGCKRKVKKILSQIHGVEIVDVDTKQQKVTVVGNVEADTLITKLAKSGKHAQLWPEKSDKSERNSKIKEKSTAERQGKVVDHQQPANPASVSPQREQRPSVKALGTKNAEGSRAAANNDDQSGSAAAKSKAVSGGGGGAAGKVIGDSRSGAAAKSEKDSGGGEAGKVIEDAPVKTSGGIRETKSTEKGDEDCSTGEKFPEKSNDGGGGGEVGASGKKKKKKGQNRNLEANELPSSSAAPPARVGPEINFNFNEPISQVTANHSPPRHQYYQPHYPHHYSPPAPPVYGMSYNTAHPNSNYTASYYAAPPPYSYAYAYPGSETEPPPIHESHPTQPLDSFEMFSDENPNGCSVA